MSITIYAARRVLTMNPSMPEATHIAVEDGRIRGVGTLKSLAGIGKHELDERFADQVILPGFVEGHSHAMEGLLWDYCYTGLFDRMDPDGRHWDGLTDVGAVQARLREHRATLSGDEPLVAWGFDPIFFTDRRLTRHELDAVDDVRPIVVLHANLHMMTVNSAMLERAGLNAHSDIEGVLLDDAGVPNGELREMAAMYAVFETIDLDIFEQASSVRAIERYGRMARRTGVTTITDLYNPLTDDAIAAMREAMAADDAPMRLVPAMSALTYGVEDGIERVLAARDQGRDNLRFGLVKLMTDGSIQGYTARLQWPYYHDGASNGMWNAPPETLTDIIHAYHQAGIQLHIHVNGDEAAGLALDAIESALELWPRADHRHTLQHAQIIDHAQLRRAARLGVCLNLFANHIYYWGDIHYERTLGPERCERLEPLATADRLGIPIAAHCDAPVTPLSPLFTAWCAVARRTHTGRTLGAREAVSVERALRMITLDAAWTLGMDDVVGSLEIGKLADMTVLEADPRDVAIDDLPAIGITATVVGGRVFANG